MSTQSFANTPIANRPAPGPSAASGYQAFPVRRAENGDISFPAFGTAVGTAFDIVAFLPDAPSAVTFSWALGAPLFQGTQLIFNGGAFDEIWFHEIPRTGTPGATDGFSGGISFIEQAEFGAPSRFGASTGLQFNGYPFVCTVADMGFLSSSGGPPAETEFIYFSANAQGVVNLGPTISPSPPTAGTVLVDERDLTQEMLDTGIVEGNAFGNPAKYLLAGTYSAIAP